MSPLDSVSPLMIGLIIIAALSVIIELGYQIGKRIGREKGLSKHPVEASVTAAILSLLAFMLGFSFATSASRQGKRRDLVLEDTNIVATAYLRADFLPPEQVKPARDLIREYLQLRTDVAENLKAEEIAPAIERSAAIQAALWEIAVEARKESKNVSLNLFITSLNVLIDTDAKRQAVALSNRLPPILWYTLGFLGTLATTMLGLSSGLHDRRSRTATTALIVAFSVVVVLIVELDRPIRSLIKVNTPTGPSSLMDKVQ